MSAADRAIAGGLQAHSIGEDYPLLVVGIGNGDQTRFRIENLQTGQVLRDWKGLGEWSFQRAEPAYEVLEALRDPLVASVAVWA